MQATREEPRLPTLLKTQPVHLERLAGEIAPACPRYSVLHGRIHLHRRTLIRDRIRNTSWPSRRFGRLVNVWQRGSKNATDRAGAVVQRTCRGRGKPAFPFDHRYASNGVAKPAGLSFAVPGRRHQPPRATAKLHGANAVELSALSGPPGPGRRPGRLRSDGEQSMMLQQSASA